MVVNGIDLYNKPSPQEYQEYLAHHGILGQKWGVRRTPEQLGQLRNPVRQAKKDAKEYARAKMFYGEGAGTRRKLIKNTVAERSKNAAYKQAFDSALAEQDMAKHVQKAKAERKVKDAKNQAAKTGRGIVNLATGHPERLGAGMMTIATAMTLAHKTGADKFIAEQGKKAYHLVVNDISVARGKQFVDKVLGKR